MKISYQKSIATKLFFIVISLYLVVALIVTGSHIFLQYKFEKNNILTGLLDIQDAFENGIEGSMWKMDQQALNASVEGVLKIPTVVGFKIINSDSQLVAIGGQLTNEKNAINSELKVDLLGLNHSSIKKIDLPSGIRLFSHCFSLRYDDFDLGKMVVFSSDLIILHRMKLQIILLGFNVAFTLITFFFALNLAVKYNLRKPLNELTKATEEIHLDNLDSLTVSIGAQEGSELKVLENSFNNMISNLDNTLKDRKKVEQSLIESEAKLRNLFDKSNDAIFIVEIESGRYLEVNRAAEILTGRSIEQLKKTTTKEVAPNGAKFRLSELENITQTTDLGEVVYIQPNGTERIAHLSVVPINDKICYGLAHDMTNRIQVEKEKEKLQNQLIQAQKMESIGRLAGGVAHDFNNMLSVIIGYSDMMLKNLPRDTQNFEMIEEINNAGVKSANLTKQLLAFARKQTISPKVIDINQTISDMLKMLQRLIGEDIDLLWRPGYDIWKIEMDPSQIDQILANLCVNARDAIDGNGRIVIETINKVVSEDYCVENTGFVSGEYILVTISDNGCGMSKETLNHVFEPFFTTKGLGKGTGLGLATIYGIIKQNNGFIHIYSELGHGTTFKIYFPKYSGKKEIIIKDSKEKFCAKSGTILLVEDEISILKMTSSMLEGIGYKVFPANSAKEAIEIASNNSNRFDLLMTDVIMPEMNGKDLSEKIKEIIPDIKRLFMSGYTADVIAHHGVLDKEVNFIQKPFSFDEVKNKLSLIFS